MHIHNTPVFLKSEGSAQKSAVTGRHRQRLGLRFGMPKKKGHKGPNTRDEVLSPVRLTLKEKRAIQRNAKTADLSVAGFVRARVLSPIGVDEKLEDPKPGGVLRSRRSSALVRAFQRVLLNLKQLDQYMDSIADDQIFDDFKAARTGLRELQSAHLESSAADVHSRSEFTDQMNELGRSLNRLTNAAHGAGEIKKPGRLGGLLSDLLKVIEQARQAPRESGS